MCEFSRGFWKCQFVAFIAVKNKCFEFLIKFDTKQNEPELKWSYINVKFLHFAALKPSQRQRRSSAMGVIRENLESNLGDIFH